MTQGWEVLTQATLYYQMKQIATIGQSRGSAECAPDREISWAPGHFRACALL